MPKQAKRGKAKTTDETYTWFQRFGLFFYDRRETTILFWLAIVLFGSLCYATFMQRQGFPNVNVPVSVVNGTYFVNSRQKVDQDVALPASRVIANIPSVETVTSQAGDNFFALVVQFEENTTSAEGNSQIEQALKDNNTIPAAAQIEFRPVDAAKFAEQSDLLVTVYSKKNINSQALEAQAETVAGELGRTQGVASAHVLKQFQTGINPETGQSTTQQRSFDRICFNDGQTACYTSATIGITAKSDTDAVHLSRQIEDKLGELAGQEKYQDITMRISADFAENIEAQIGSLEHSLLEGLLAVLIVSFLLISWRASITTALSMITVLLLTIAALYITGNSLNTITLFALILSLGLIVDDTTIMVEAIDAAKRESRSKRKIVAAAMKRVARASTAGTLTTMLAFAPMLFVSGVLGEFIRILPITIITALACSLLISLALVPLLASGIILRKKPAPSRNPILKVEAAISGGLARLIMVGKRSRKTGIVIGVTAIVFSLGVVFASFAYFQKLKFDIFPSTKDSDAIMVTIRFAPGTSIAQAQAITDTTNAKTAEVLGSHVRRISYQNSGNDMSATGTATLISYQDRDITAPQLVDDLQKALGDVAGAQIKVSQVDVGPPKDDLPFRVQISSENQMQATRLANDIAAYVKGLEITRVNGTKAMITRAEVANPTQITRIDSNLTAEVRAGFDADDTSALVSLARDKVRAEFTAARLAQYGISPDDLVFDFGAESENQDSFKSMIFAFPLLLLVMYLLMALLFRSFLQPLLIFMAIPFSFFGVAYGLHITDNPLSFFVLVGFFALIGIAVNNTILLTDYANQSRAQGMGRIDAIATAIRARFRPLLTTSITSIVALIPLALQDPFWESLSYTLIFGLLSSTILVTIAFPYYYLAGEVLRAFGHRLWTRQYPKPIQYPLDILIAPVRIGAFLLHIIFHARSTGVY